MDWELIRTFCEVMKGDGLAAAATRLNVSVATVSRRIRALESERGETLFAKTAAGYQPTDAANRLFQSAQPMEAAATALKRNAPGAIEAANSAVRISAGNWLCMLLAGSASRFLETEEIAAIEIHNEYGFSSLAGDEADIALRNRRPEKGRYVCRRFAAPGYAVFAAPSFIEGAPEIASSDQWAAAVWAGLEDASGSLPSVRWVKERINKSPDIACSQAVNVLDAVAGGSALGLLPIFVGQRAGLRALSEPITLEDGSVWSVVHEDVYARAPVKAALGVVSQLLSNCTVD